MKKILLTLCLMFGIVGTVQAVKVETIYNEWTEIDKIYLITDEERGVMCYLVSPSNDRTTMECLPIQEAKK